MHQGFICKKSRLALLIGIVVWLGGANLWAQPDTLWTRHFDKNSNRDVGESAQQTSDGGYIVVGWTGSYKRSDFDVWLIKTDGSGNKLWDKTFGGTESDRGYSVEQTTDGGYIITGHTNSYGAGSADVWLIKTDANGDTLWTRTFGGSDQDVGYSVQQTADGGFIIAGQTESFGAGGSDVYLIKTDASGNQQWYKTFGGSHYDHGKCVQQTADGGYVIVGDWSYGAALFNVWLIKTDANGTKVWDKTFGGPDWDCGNSVQQTRDGGYIIVGTTVNYGAGSSDIWLIKTNASGNKQWSKTFGAEDIDDGWDVQQTTDGGYIIVGDIEYVGAGYFDVYLVKTNANGTKEWDKTIGGTQEDRGLSIQQTTDGGYIIAGKTRSFGTQGYYDVYLIRIKGEAGIEEADDGKADKRIRVFPNPFVSRIAIRGAQGQIGIYNADGRLVRRIDHGVWDGKDAGGDEVQSGVYFLKAAGHKAVKVLKLR